MSPVLPLRVLVGIVLIAAVSAPVVAAPFVPESDSQVLERLPFAPNDPVLSRLHALNTQLTGKPDNLPLALLVAQSYLEVSRVTGDPRLPAMPKPRWPPGGALSKRPRKC
jgi:hypothetical protein